MSDGEFEYLLVCRGHRINIYQLTSFTSKHRMGVCMDILQTFCFMGTPDALQGDNSSEFINAAREGEGSLISFSDEELSEVIVIIK